MKPRCYIAGPMTRIPLFNFPAFDAATAEVRALGYEPLSPADLDRAAGFDPMGLPADWDWSVIPDTFDMGAAFDRDIEAIKSSEAIYMLAGWQQSTGATAEYHLAKWRKLTIHYQQRPESILEEADRLTGGDRNNDYGHPAHDFNRTAKIWSALLNVDVTAQQVALCMVGVKMSRLTHRYKRDSVVDIAGYARTMEMVEDYRG